MTSELTVPILATLLGALTLICSFTMYRLGYMNGEIGKIALALEAALEEQDEEGADAEQRDSENAP